MIDRSLFTLPKVGMVLGLLLVVALAQAACILGEAYSLARAITNLWEGGTVAAQAGLIGIFAACFIGNQVIVYARDTFLARFAHARASELRNQLLEEVFGAKTNLVSREGTAAVAQAALEGVDQVETYLALILPKIISVVAIPLPIFIAAFILDWVSGIILLAFFPVIIFFMIILGRQASARAAAQYETYNALSNHFVDTLRGIETLAVFGKAKSYAKRIFKVSEDFRWATIDTLKTATLSGAVLDLFATLGVAAVSLMLGFRLLGGTILLFPALMVLILSPEFFKPVREFAADFHASLDGKNALVAITRMVSGGAREADTLALSNWGKNAVLRFNSVNFSYACDNVQSEHEHEAGSSSGSLQTNESAENAAQRPALKDIHFEITGFAKVGIVGVSGSGKSTLINVLGGFANPTSGTIAVAGQAATSLQHAAWQKQILYIPQDPYIFHASLRDNMCFYSPAASADAIQHAIKVCGLEQLVAELPEGLDTIIGEGGRALSGGQAQRIAFARALLDPTRKVLLFDEPTAHLDIETELELKKRMLPIMEGRLVFFATHRLHWLSAMDHILVLENGEIVEQGSLDELLAKGGKLVALAKAMNGGGAA